MLTRSHAFDIIVITAANEAQASSYRAQLEARVRQGLLREGTLWRVVTDPGGRRVGSGSSTLAVLSQLADTVCQDGGDFTERFSQHRILIAHSGGDARRIPAYAPQGKIFMPLPCDVPPTGQPPWQRHPAALFDLILQTLSKLPTAPEGEIIICAGDVLLTFNSEETNLHTPGGITGLGFAVPPDVGEQHGVYVAATPSLGGPVLDFLQKPSRSEILAEGAIDPSGRVLIDTGVFCIAPAAAEALLHAAGIGLKGSRVVMNAGLQRDLMESRVSLVDLYREVALALPAAMSRERYLSNLSPTNSTRSAQKSFGQFFDRLHDTALPFNVVAVPDGEFFHIGTTRELLTKFTEPSRTARAFHFENGYRSHNLSKLTMPGPASHLLAANPLAANLATVPGKKPQTQNVAKRQDVVNVNGLTLFNAVTDFEHLQVHGLSYIENTVLSSQNAASQNVESTVELGGDNVLVGLWDATALLAHRSSLPRGIGFTVWPVRSPIVNGQEDSRQQVPPTIEVPIVFGVQDDNKGTYESGLCRLLNQPIELLIKAGIAPEVLWPTEEERSIWTAKIWCSGQAGWDTIELLLNIFTEPLEHPESPEHSESPQHLRQPVLGPPVASLAKGTRKQQHQRLKQWRAQQRWSLSDLLPLVDHTVDLLRRHQMAATYYHQQVLALLLDYPNLAVVDILAQVTDVDNQGEAAAELLNALLRQWETYTRQADQGRQGQEISVPPLTQARIQRAAGVLAEIVENGAKIKAEEANLIQGNTTQSAKRTTSRKEVPGTKAKKDAGSKNGKRVTPLLQTISGVSSLSANQNPLPKAGEFNQAALSAVANALESTLELRHDPRPARILHDQAVWVTAPARIDFAGGWSDTPPICLEQGGVVLNAAITINQQYPIQVVAKLNEERCIRLTSIDLGQREIYREAAAINGPPDLNHWSSLAKMALVLAGIVPARPSSFPLGTSKKTLSLDHWLDVLGGGLDLTLFSGLPKGSGMGTSSILGAAVLACLARVLGQELTHSELIAQTSLLEQRMTSGGGWQDQVGGIVAGVKLIRTQPGMAQIPALQWTVFGGVGPTSNVLQRRILLYFTGQKRLAANILQNVLGRYLAREPAVLQIINRLKAGAEMAKQSLEANDLATFAQCVDEYWELKKALDPGTTNEAIEAIIKQVQPYTVANLLCGAGGGGFMLLMARDEEATHQIRQVLQHAPPNPQARFFDFAVDPQGLGVSVL